IDPKSGHISLVTVKKVVAEVTNPQEEISLADAKKVNPEVEMDGEVSFEKEFDGIGRIAAQTAKQVIIQRVKEAEREMIMKEYRDKLGDLTNGIVMRQEKGNYIIDLGKTEGVLPPREQMPRESYSRGDRVRAYILDIKDSAKGPQVILSRSHPGMVAKLFEMEVPEIYEGIVEIKNAAREAGDRTKILVASKAPDVDPVGACVGIKGSRVQAVVRELRGEKIDIVPYNEDVRALIARALSPAVIEKVGINEEDRSALVIVPDHQLSLAIGKRGQNVRLAARLINWKIDIMSEAEYDKEGSKERENEIEAALAKELSDQAEKERPLPTLNDIPGIGDKIIEHLAEAGLDSVEAIASASEEALTGIEGIGSKTARKILEGARALTGQK
ncbi:MAG: transcription termination factor NusA, partial [Nitrospirota bacterium]|nr:transcription termination factor NusA [Nitrospirota bacterium]